MSRKPAVVGHRGARAIVSENTLTGFRRAEADGADGVELDVICSKDGVPVVMHDDDIDRTTTGRGRVHDLDLAQLRAVDAGDGHGVPTLTEALDSVPLTFQIEVKDLEGVPAIVEAVAIRSDTERLTLSSDDIEVLRRIGTPPAKAKLGLISKVLDDDVLATAAELGVTMLYPGIDGTTRAAVDAAHAAGMEVHIWMINDRETLLRAIELDVDAVTTDDPGAVVQLLDTLELT